MNIVARFKTKQLIKQVLREWEEKGEILRGWKVSWNRKNNSFKIDVEPTEKLKNSSRMNVKDF